MSGSTGTMVVAGGSGVVGRHLLSLARSEGFTIRMLTRGDGHDAPTGAHTVRWEPAAAAAGQARALADIRDCLEGADLLVNLAGTSLADGRLNDDHKRRVLQSRLNATRALAKAHADCGSAPGVWINASATGYYGHRGEEEIDEQSSRGGGFLSAVCERWEAEVAQVTQARVIVARIGLVLAADAPAWRKLLLPTRLGIGGPLGSGEQWWAWIDADELARALLFLYREPEASGVYNLTTPAPVRQLELARQTGVLFHRPALFPTPAALLRIAIGGVADELLLPSCRAMPTRLQALGFPFQRPSIERELLDLRDAEGA